MERISIYIRSYELSPSGYYRIIQYTKKLPGKFIVHNILPHRFYKFYLQSKKRKWLQPILGPLTFFLAFFRTLFFLLYDSFTNTKAVVISRGLTPRFFPIIIKLACNRLLSKSRLIWDFDDNILDSKEISKKEFEYLSKKSEHIIVTHAHLRSLITTQYINKIIILPTTDGDFMDFDHASLLNKRMLLFEAEIRLIWVGTAVNLTFVEDAIAALDQASNLFFQTTGKKIILTIASSAPLIYHPKAIVINNVTWSRDMAIAEMNNSHIGIMPLKQSTYALGKGGFKLIQYMATGLPIIGSDVGFNHDIINNKFGELIPYLNDANAWYNAIYSIAETPHTYKAKSIEALNTWNTNFSYNKSLAVWGNILFEKEVCNKDN